jgi:hypothetical protein
LIFYTSRAHLSRDGHKIWGWTFDAATTHSNTSIFIQYKGYFTDVHELIFSLLVRIFQEILIKSHIGAMHWPLHPRTAIHPYLSIIRTTLLTFVFRFLLRFVSILQEMVIKPSRRVITSTWWEGLVLLMIPRAIPAGD